MKSLQAYRREIEKALGEALSDCMAEFPKREFEEPDYTAGIALGLPKYTAGIALGVPKQMKKKGSLPGLRFGGCFIHQSPRITYQYHGKTSCELGDLLILYRDRTAKRERFNAALMQLKMADRTDIDAKQCRVYTQWPPFDFGMAFSDKPHYDVYPKTVTQGALYVFVHTETNLRFTVAAPNDRVYANGIDIRHGEPLEQYLSGFVTWTNGRTISDERCKREDSWSYLVWNLIDFLKDKAFRRRNISQDNSKNTKERFDRRNGDFFNDLLEEDIEVERDIMQEPIGNQGIGLLLIDKSNPTNEIDVNEGR